MFDPFRIDRRDPGIDPDGEEEAEDDLVSSATGGREAAAGIREADRLARSSLRQTVSLQSLDGPDHRDVRDPETRRQLGHPTAVLTVFQLGDRFAVVLGDLRCVIVSGALVGG